MVLLKESIEFSENYENIRRCLTILSNIIGENSNNKSVTLPILGSILTLRDRNYDATLEYLIN